MKKTILILVAGFVIIACNNKAESEVTTDSTNYQEKDNNDKNNMNTTVYDSAAGNQRGDTASYENMPNKINDSIKK
jgi:uncharacterized protein YxeA